jgi:hypothetical protein
MPVHCTSRHAAVPHHVALVRALAVVAALFLAACAAPPAGPPELRNAIQHAGRVGFGAGAGIVPYLAARPVQAVLQPSL